MRDFTGWVGFTIDARDPRALGEFYARLTGWELRVEDHSWVTLHRPGSEFNLAFHLNELYEPPVWPTAPGTQQHQAHLDLGVRDVAAAVEEAVQAGGRLHPVQPQDEVRVMLDPEGHTFCLYQDGDPSGTATGAAEGQEPA